MGPVALVAVLALLASMAAACSSDSSDSSDSDTATDETTGPVDGAGGETDTGEASATTAVEEADQEASEEGGEDAAADEQPAEGEAAAEVPATEDSASTADEAESPLGTGGATVTPTAADLGRKLIFTAQVHVEVDDVAAASSEATSIVEGLGGFVFGQNTTGGPEPSSELVFKVLPDDFKEVLEQLGTVGELRNQTVTTDDVTERIVDLESRIQVADLGVARLRAALEGAATLEDYAQLEQLLLNRESELEVMRGQLRTLQDQVDLATITLLLTRDRVENAIDLRISTYQDHDNGESCPGEEGLTLEAGSDITVCFDVVNIGDQTLTDIVLTDTVLEIDGDTELIEVFGSLDELAPGQSTVAAYELNPERSLRLRTRVTAIPTDGVSLEQAGPSVSTQINFDLRTFEPESDPGFGDGFSVAVSVLRALWVAVVVTVGFLVPLLVLLPFVVLAWWGWRELRRRRPKAPPPPSSGPTGSLPPPPAPPAAVGAQAHGSAAETTTGAPPG